MFDGFLRKLFGSSNERRIKGYRPRVDEINALEKELEKLTDDALRARTDEFRKQLADGKTLDEILVPAFATCREAAKRTLGQRLDLGFQRVDGGDPRQITADPPLVGGAEQFAGDGADHGLKLLNV